MTGMNGTHGISEGMKEGMFPDSMLPTETYYGCDERAQLARLSLPRLKVLVGLPLRHGRSWGFGLLLVKASLWLRLPTTWRTCRTHNTTGKNQVRFVGVSLSAVSLSAPSDWKGCI